MDAAQPFRRILWLTAIDVTKILFTQLLAFAHKIFCLQGYTAPIRLITQNIILCVE